MQEEMRMEFLDMLKKDGASDSIQKRKSQKNSSKW